MAAQCKVCALKSSIQEHIKKMLNDGHSAKSVSSWLKAKNIQISYASVLRHVQNHVDHLNVDHQDNLPFTIDIDEIRKDFDQSEKIDIARMHKKLLILWESESDLHRHAQKKLIAGKGKSGSEHVRNLKLLTDMLIVISKLEYDLQKETVEFKMDMYHEFFMAFLSILKKDFPQGEDILRQHGEHILSIMRNDIIAEYERCHHAKKY
ncbi:MAG: hypothetical protein GY749_48145 [Desulfobacteraceae bacterium]|nr:hypothetical protein [Desulfobacteraceae bacterium]